MEKLMKQESIPDVPQSEDAYRSIRGYVIEAQDLSNSMIFPSLIR